MQITLTQWDTFSDEEKSQWVAAQSTEKLYSLLDWLEKLLDEANNLNGVADGLPNDNELYIIRERTYKRINTFVEYIVYELHTNRKESHGRSHL